MLVISFFALAVLWPKPRLEQRQLAPAARRARDRRAAPVQIVCGAIGVVPARRDVLAGYLGAGDGAGQLGADVPPDHVLGRAGVRVDPVRRRLPRVQPVAGDRAAAAVAEPARTRSGSGAGPPRSGCSSSPGSSSSRAGARTRRRSSRPRSATRVLTLAAQFVLRRRDVDAPRRGVRGLLQHVRAHVGRSRRATACSACGAPLGGLPRLDPVAGHGRVRDRDDRHGHLRRPLPGPAVEGRLGRPRRRARRARDRRADGVEDRRDVRAAARRRRSSPASTGSGSRARARSAAGSRSSELELGFIHTLVPIAAVYVAAHYLTFLLFEGQAIIYLASDPFGAGLGPLRHGQLGDRLLGLPAGGHVVRAGRGGRASATSRR